MFGIVGATPKNLLVQAISQKHLLECARIYLGGLARSDELCGAGERLILRRTEVKDRATC